jgi:bifunctional DNase/RNase
MMPMRLRNLGFCARHTRALIVLEDVSCSRRLTFYADPGETQRLQRILERGSGACHPVYDFIRVVLATLGARAIRVVLEDVEGQGIGALVQIRQGESDTEVNCYPPDAIALAIREHLPIYATEAALDHAEPVTPPPAGPGDVADWLERVQPRDFGSPRSREEK